MGTIWCLFDPTHRLVQIGCSFHGLRFEDPNQHLKDFLKLVDSLDLNGDNRERTRLFLFQFPLRDQASNWLDCLPAGSISTWRISLFVSLLNSFTERILKLCNDKLDVQHTRLNLLRSINLVSRAYFFQKVSIMVSTCGSNESKKRLDYYRGCWHNYEVTIRVCIDSKIVGVQIEMATWYRMEAMECQVDLLMKEAISLVEKSENLCRIVSKKIWQSFPRPSRQKEFEGLMTNFILDQEEKVR
ncbi:hypothetical protein Tco_0464800 [Tanacetum coccineum]